jgi:Restriction Enzyme Adenine Methylase Associated
MLVFGDRKFIQETFSSEDEIEKVVTNNSEYIFGSSSIYFSKALIKTIDGVGTIPDGFVIDLSSRQWYIVEAELATHNVWSHISPQVAKQITAARSGNSRKRIAQFMVNTIKDDKISLEKFQTEGIQTINIHQTISEILEKQPIIGMPIDIISNDLKEWATTLSSEVKLWVIQKYVEFGKPSVILYEFPEEFKPAFDTKIDDPDQPDKFTQYDVKISDLVKAELLSFGEKLFMTYKPKNGKKQDYETTIQENGSLIVFGETFTSPSYAALYCIKNAGSPRNTTNGWNSWKNAEDQVLAKLRDQYLALKAKSK